LSSTTVVLGSASATRRGVLESLGVRHVVVRPEVDEKATRRDDPRELVVALARVKADKVMEIIETRGFASALGEGAKSRVLIITCDQVVVHGGVVREKPTSVDEARGFIRGYGLEPPMTIGSVMVTDLATRRSACAVDENKVVFDGPFPEALVEALAADRGCMNCAGGLMVEHELVTPYLNRIEGSMDGVMGLSAATVERLLREFI